MCFITLDSYLQLFICKSLYSFQVWSSDLNLYSYGKNSETLNTGVLSFGTENTDGSPASINLGSGVTLSINSNMANPIPPKAVDTPLSLNSSIGHNYTIVDRYSSLQIKLSKSDKNMTYVYLGRFDAPVTTDEYDLRVVVGDTIEEIKTKIKISTSYKDDVFVLFIPSSQMGKSYFVLSVSTQTGKHNIVL